MNETKEQFQEAYKDYRDTVPEGLDERHAGRIEPLIYEIPGGSTVLDIGANSGEIMKLVEERRQCHVFGVDVSEVAIAKAKEKGIEIFKADAENLPFQDNHFDVVLLMETLNHVHDPLAALQEARRVLKPDGILLGSVPHRNLEKYLWEEAKPHHPYHTLESLGELLDKVFKYTHLWPLKGAMLSVKFASTFLAGDTAEILFKCGSSCDDHRWWSLMAEKDVLRAWFGPTQAEGTAYYRMLGFAAKMRERGIESAYEEVHYSNTDDHARWQNRCRNRIVLDQLDAILKVADVSVWQAVMTSDALALLKCWRDMAKCVGCGRFRPAPQGILRCECKATSFYRKPIITEIDDWLLEVPHYNIASGPFKPNSKYEWLVIEQLKLSDAIITSTEFLLESLRKVPDLTQKAFHVIPNSLDFSIWDKLQEPPIKKPDGIVRIGYTGCGNHGGDLHMIREAILTILNEFPNVEFIYAVHMKDPHDPSQDFDIIHPRARCLNEWYTIKQYPQALRNWDLDIGIAPLLDNNFNRAKSNLRWLEYSAVKVPTIASAVEPFKKSILNNEDGILCRGLSQWYAALKELVQSKEQRLRLGEAAYRRVKRDFNMDSTTDRYVRILEELKRHAKIPARSRSLEAA